MPRSRRWPSIDADLWFFKAQINPWSAERFFLLRGSICQTWIFLFLVFARHDYLHYDTFCLRFPPASSPRWNDANGDSQSSRRRRLTCVYHGKFSVHSGKLEYPLPTIYSFLQPNTVPPIKTTEQALSYKKELEALAPQVTFYMTLYLSPELTVEEIRKASKAGIAGDYFFETQALPPPPRRLTWFAGVKSYPRGVTTNSESGIESYEIYYPIFQAMEEEGMVLNLHGEIPSDSSKDICVMNAEERFLPQLEKIHKAFPKLKIVLEHATTKAAVDTVKRLGDTVACSITVHHLQLIVDDWAGQPHHFCKPVAKYPHDREALREVVSSGQLFVANARDKIIEI